MLAAADRLEGIQGGGVPGDQSVEEMPEGNQGLVLGETVAGELVNEAAGQARRDLGISRCSSSHQARKRLTTRA